MVVGFTDHYGRLFGKRYDAEMFIDSIVEDGAPSELVAAGAGRYSDLHRAWVDSLA